MARWCFDLRVPRNPDSSWRPLDYLLNLDYSSVVLGLEFSSAEDLDSRLRSSTLLGLIEALEDHGFRSYILLIPESPRLLQKVPHPWAFLLGLEGGSKQKNLKIVTNYRIDVLLNPSKDVKLKDYLHNVSSGIDDKLLNALKNKALFFAVPYSRVLALGGYYRSLAIRQLVQDLYLLKKKQVPTILSLGSSDLRFLRDPEDLLVFLEVFGSDRGLNWDWLERLLEFYPESLLELKRQLLPGLKVVDLLLDEDSHSVTNRGSHATQT